MGWALPLLALVAILYAGFGNFLPDYLAPHGGYQWDRIVGQSYATMEGIYGLTLYVIFYYVFLFVLFGTFLEATGATDFLLNFSRWLFGGYTAGPAKMSVLTSGMIGTVSGSAVANVVTDGTFTIPLMKRSGFSPAWAAAVEAATSTGGALMPPVMGAAAFLMAEFLGISYVEICKAAVIPAILYYVALFACVHFYGQRMGIVGLPRQELPS
ncbi:MAG: TRAP transporter large permease subunit, partial [Acidobacteria bacterium]|nr:TRAP transporter large permease subunit [Acidobacteriota bacterium]